MPKLIIVLPVPTTDVVNPLGVSVLLPTVPMPNPRNGFVVAFMTRNCQELSPLFTALMLLSRPPVCVYVCGT